MQWCPCNDCQEQWVKKGRKHIRRKILVTQRDAWGNTLCIYRHEGSYRVGTVSSHGRPIPLAQAQYLTYEHALTRLQDEAQRRQALVTTT